MLESRTSLTGPGVAPAALAARGRQQLQQFLRGLTVPGTQLFESLGGAARAGLLDQRANLDGQAIHGGPDRLRRVGFEPPHQIGKGLGHHSAPRTM
jgi:hypothetical protein